MSIVIGNKTVSDIEIGGKTVSKIEIDNKIAYEKETSKLPDPVITAQWVSEGSGGYGHTRYTIETAGVSGVKYYIRKLYSSAYSPRCTEVTDPTQSSYTATGTGTGSNSTYSYNGSYRQSNTGGEKIKVLGVKDGYADSDIVCS